MLTLGGSNCTNRCQIVLTSTQTGCTIATTDFESSYHIAITDRRVLVLQLGTKRFQSAIKRFVESVQLKESEVGSLYLSTVFIARLFALFNRPTLYHQFYLTWNSDMKLTIRFLGVLLSVCIINAVGCGPPSADENASMPHQPDNADLRSEDRARSKVVDGDCQTNTGDDLASESVNQDEVATVNQVRGTPSQQTQRKATALPEASKTLKNTQSHFKKFASKRDELRKLYLEVINATQESDKKVFGQLVEQLVPDRLSLQKALKNPSDVDLVETWQSRTAIDVETIADQLSKLLDDLSSLSDETLVNVHASTTEELIANREGSVARDHFPQGARYAAANFLAPGTTFYVVENAVSGNRRYHQLMELFGLASVQYGMFFHDGKDWKLLGPIWRAFPVATNDLNQSWRFKEILNEEVEIRDRLPCEFDQNQIKEISSTLLEVEAFYERFRWLKNMLHLRQNFADSDFVDQQLLASLRDETFLPVETKARRDKLRNQSAKLSEPIRTAENFKHLQKKLLEGNLRRGQLFSLAVYLRLALDEYVLMREFELEQDAFLLSFPTMRLRDLVGFKENQQNSFASHIRREYPSFSTMSTARELWPEVPKPFKPLPEYGYGARYNDTVQSGHSGKPAKFSVLNDEQFQQFLHLWSRIEELGGGSTHLLVPPEIKKLPARERIVEASKRNLAAIRDADKQAFINLREHLYNQLEERSKSYAESDKDDSREELQEEFERLRPKYNLSDYGFFCLLNCAIKLDLADEQVLQKSDGKTRSKFKKLRLRKRQERYFTGASYYFRDVSMIPKRSAPLSKDYVAERQWNDSAGRYSFDATFIDLVDGRVRLKKADGTHVLVQLDRLSDADRDYVTRRTVKN